MNIKTLYEALNDEELKETALVLADVHEEIGEMQKAEIWRTIYNLGKYPTNMEVFEGKPYWEFWSSRHSYGEDNYHILPTKVYDLLAETKKRFEVKYTSRKEGILDLFFLLLYNPHLIQEFSS